MQSPGVRLVRKRCGGETRRETGGRAGKGIAGERRAGRPKGSDVRVDGGVRVVYRLRMDAVPGRIRAIFLEAWAMKLTTRSRYGTRMILDMALNGQNGPVRIKDIAARQGVSVKYLEKLVRELKEAGFVKSRRGPHGGHELARPLETLSVGEVVRALEGDMTLVDCSDEKSGCPRSADCLTRGVWIAAARAMHEKLDSITLADLVKIAGTCPGETTQTGAGANCA